MMSNNIIWGNEDATIETAQQAGDNINNPLLFGTALTSTQSLNNLIEDGALGSADISVDPGFEYGFYLNQLALAPLGPIDAGSQLAQVRDFVGYITAANGAGDAANLDLGYHYMEGAKLAEYDTQLLSSSKLLAQPGVQEVRVKPLAGSQALGDGQLLEFSLNPTSTAAVQLSSLTGLGNAGVIAKDNGDGSYSISLNAVPSGTGSIVIDVWVNHQPTANSISLSY